MEETDQIDQTLETTPKTTLLPEQPSQLLRLAVQDSRKAQLLGYQIYTPTWFDHRDEGPSCCPAAAVYLVSLGLDPLQESGSDLIARKIQSSYPTAGADIFQRIRLINILRAGKVLGLTLIYPVLEELPPTDLSALNCYSPSEAPALFEKLLKRADLLQEYGL